MWDFFSPKELQWYVWFLNGAKAGIRKNGEEWRIIQRPCRFEDLVEEAYGPEERASCEEENLAFGVGPARQIRLVPSFSQIPYLVLVRNEVRILPGAEAQFMVAVPPVFQFQDEESHVLYEFLPFSLSYSWFGDKTSGTLCLSLPIALDPHCKGETTTKGTQTDELNKWTRAASLIQCDITVRNATRTVLNIKRLAIYTDLMNIYYKDGRLYSDSIIIDGTPEGELRMRIDESKKRSYKKIFTAAKAGLSEILVRRGVGFLKSITGLYE
ncbi:MAG: hypothetical protein N2Z76_04465 [Treponemataceae bacterium]|nr:hypothetical protein [Treponemataceae bacterium]